MTLRLPRELVDKAVWHALDDHPLEACGVMGGPKGKAPIRAWALRNAAQDRHTRYRLDPQEQLQLWWTLDGLGWDPLVVYHSHTATPPIPSRFDIAHAEPRRSYLIISTMADVPVLRSWYLHDSRMVEEPLIIE